MSYDFSLCRASEREQAKTDSFDSTTDPDPILEQRKQRLAETLIQANPKLSIFPIGHAELARFQKITESEARRRFRYLELNGPDDGNGLQITLKDRTAFVTIPFWHSAEAAIDVLKELWRYFRVFAREGFEIHDNQLDRKLDVDADADVAAVLRSYGRGVHFTQQLIEDIRKGKPKG